MQAVKALAGSARLCAPAASLVQAQPVARRAQADGFVAVRSTRDALLAPPSFEVNGKTVVFADIQNVDSTVVLDCKARKTTVSATVDFELAEKGRPVIELAPSATKVTVDGKVIDPKSYANVSDPANESRFRIIDVELEPGKHRVEIEYDLSAGIRYSGNSVEVFTRKSDLDDRSMDEQYFPTNLEYDQYPGKLTFDIRNSSIKHRVMTNGDVSDEGGKLVVTYPSHFNTASRFLNVINPADFAIVDDTYAGAKATIPITLYTPRNLRGGSRAFAGTVGVKHEPGEHHVSTKGLTPEQISARGIEIAKAALAKHEKDFGPFPHSRLLIRNSGSGGMEYCGAIESDLGSIPHELHHQWFARSAQPANGNAGWIDEAAASWHDHGYNSRTSPPSFPRKLSGFPAWHRITPQAAYSHGADVLAYIDHVLAPNGGLRPVLAKWFAAESKRVFTTEMFLSFIKEQGSGTGFDFDAFFKAQVYGSGLAQLRRRAARRSRSAARCSSWPSGAREVRADRGVASKRRGLRRENDDRVVLSSDFDAHARKLVRELRQDGLAHRLLALLEASLAVGIDGAKDWAENAAARTLWWLNSARSQRPQYLHRALDYRNDWHGDHLEVRISADREQSDRRIVNTKIGSS